MASPPVVGVSALDICIKMAICCRSERGTFNLPLCDFPPDEGDPKAPGLAPSAEDDVAASEKVVAQVSPPPSTGGEDVAEEIVVVVVVVLEAE